MTDNYDSDNDDAYDDDENYSVTDEETSCNSTLSFIKQTNTILHKPHDLGCSGKKNKE